MEIQKTLGEFRSDINANTKAIDSLKTKVDDLVGWKHRIVGGVVVVGILCSALAFLIGKFWDYFSFRAPQATATVSTPAAPPPQPSAPAPERTGNRR